MDCAAPTARNIEKYVQLDFFSSHGRFFCSEKRSKSAESTILSSGLIGDISNLYTHREQKNRPCVQKDLLSYDVQLNLLIGFPLNCEALAERLDNAPQYEEAGSGTGTMDSEGDRWMVIHTDATQEEIALVRNLIESTDRIFRGNNEIMAIIEEVAPLYLSGDRTLEDAVRIIQSRIQTYVSEQSW